MYTIILSAIFVITVGVFASRLDKTIEKNYPGNPFNAGIAGIIAAIPATFITGVIHIIATVANT